MKNNVIDIKGKNKEPVLNPELERLCKLSQFKLKEDCNAYLTELGYETVNEDGFLYAKGSVPVLLVAHMDTVHKKNVKTILKDMGGDVITSPQGIGGDDRCGIYAIREIVKELHCSVLFCEDEEIGCVGTKKFCKTEYINKLDVNYMIEIDRQGNRDAVFYECDNPEFTNFITSNTMFVEDYGSYTDICHLMDYSGIAGVNFSSGYYNAHTINEYIVLSELEEIIQEIKELIQIPSERYEYVERVYGRFGYGGYGRLGGYDIYDDFEEIYEYTQADIEEAFDMGYKHMLKGKQFYITYVDEDGINSNVASVVAVSKEEAIGKLLMEEDIKYSDIYDIEEVDYEPLLKRRMG